MKIINVIVAVGIIFGASQALEAARPGGTVKCRGVLDTGQRVAFITPRVGDIKKEFLYDWLRWIADNQMEIVRAEPDPLDPIYLDEEAFRLARDIR